MYTMNTVESFVNVKDLALLGASRTGKKFGNIVMKELIKKGYNIFPVHPSAKEIDGIKCYNSLSDLNGKVDAALFVLKPAQTETELKNALASGIKKVWLQQGSESEAAIKFCDDNNIEAVHGHCIMMFTPKPGFMHGTHKFIWKVIGKMPKAEV